MARRSPRSPVVRGRPRLMRVALFVSGESCRPTSLCFISETRPIRNLAIARLFCFLQEAPRFGRLPLAGRGNRSAEARNRGKGAVRNYNTSQRTAGLQRSRDAARHGHFAGGPCGGPAAPTPFDSFLFLETPHTLRPP